MEKPTPLEAIKFRLDQMGLKESYLGELIGTSRKSEILSGVRKLNLNQIRTISKKLQIPAEILIQEY